MDIQNVNGKARINWPEKNIADFRYQTRDTKQNDFAFITVRLMKYVHGLVVFCFIWNIVLYAFIPR